MKIKREALGMTMKSVAEKLNISESYYCGIENGTRQKKMDISLASALSAIFGMPVAEIVENEKSCDSVAPEGV